MGSYLRMNLTITHEEAAAIVAAYEELTASETLDLSDLGALTAVAARIRMEYDIAEILDEV